MYIWIGIDVDDQLPRIKAAAKEIEDRIGFRHSNFTLPLHISLKISFPVPEDQAAKVMRDITAVFEETPGFSIPVQGIFLDEVITWILMKENPTLNALHDRLNSLLLEKYQIPLHEYDLDYKFHTTLFMDDDRDKVCRAYKAIRDIPVPDNLIANCFVIGTSPTGKLGSYRVVHQIRV
mgnify:CR=1 FL=1